MSRTHLLGTQWLNSTGSGNSEVMASRAVKFLHQEGAQAMHEELLHEYQHGPTYRTGWVQLFNVIAKAYPSISMSRAPAAVPIICGPGNNGEGSLLCAWHPKHFGHQPIIFDPKRPNKPLYTILVTHHQERVILFPGEVPPEPTLINELYGLGVDAIFGFSFKGNV
nr:NAD(P)H-hydrate epimerase-like [Chlorocebus sabaeus]